MEVVAVIQALLDQGQRMEDTAIYGDSSGGGLAAAVVLKMRDRGMGMPAAAVLVSPWLDVTNSGDTESHQLHDADPNQLYEKHSRYAAAAYADPQDHKHPYVSPVYGDFSKGFPPTLIQGGPKEVLLSGFVRFYQALDVAGVPVKLDLYEGMIHNFRTAFPTRRSRRSLSKLREFLCRRLGL
ncbi:MAG: alpha/beta hydrolase fold domain-containing protein [Candidatus Binatia bacterium]